MYGKVLSDEEAKEALRRIQAEIPGTVERTANSVSATSPLLAARVGALEPECLSDLLQWALPIVKKGAKIGKNGRIDYAPEAAAVISDIAEIYAAMLLAYSPKLELRIGNHPKHPDRYVYQNHVVVGVAGRPEEIDPFIVAWNLFARLLREGAKPSIGPEAFRLWVRECILDGGR